MASQDSTPLRTASRNLLIAAIVILIGIGAATAFAVGFSGALEDSLANPSSAPAMRIAALERLRDELGHDGFLKSFREGAESSTLVRSVREADEALNRFREAAETERDEVDGRAMAALLAPFQRAARDRLLGTPAPDPITLEQSYAALKLKIGEAIDAARNRRTETLIHAFAVAQTLAVLALSALSITLFGLAWFLRTRLLEPLRALRRSAEKAADGGLFRGLWGIERSDEIGALARAANRLRRQLAFEAEETATPSGEIRAVLENHTYHPSLGSANNEIGAVANRIEADLAHIIAVVGEAKHKIEDASRDAALASQTAVEAANLARQGAISLTEKAERAIAIAGNDAQSLLAALTSSVARLNQTASRLDAANVAIVPIRESTPQIGHESLRPIGRDGPTPLNRLTGPAIGRASNPTIGDSLRPILTAGHNGAGDYNGSRSSYRDAESEKERIESDLYAALARLAEAKQSNEHECAAPLAGLASDLDTLETLTRNGAIAKGDAQVLTAALIEAIDRLNGVVENVAATIEKKPMRRDY